MDLSLRSIWFVVRLAFSGGLGHLRPLLIAVILLGLQPLAAASADFPSARNSIVEIEEAGIFCPRGPEEIGPKFYKYVQRSCVGRLSCRVSPTAIATETELRSYGCTHFFVWAICRKDEFREFTSKGLSERLLVTCE